MRLTNSDWIASLQFLKIGATVLLHQISGSPLLHHRNKVLDGTVVATLHIVWKIASGQLAFLLVVG